MAGPSAAPAAPNGNGAGTAISPYKKRITDLAGFLDGRKAMLAQVLPRTLTPERLVKIAVQAIAKSKELLQCTPLSIYSSVHHAAQLGLEPGGPLGGAYLVPFRNKGRWECQLIVGYRGLIDLARRSGQVLSIEAHVVRDGDEFQLEYGLEPRLVHKPNLKATEPAPMVFAYAVACLRDGAKQCEVMTRAEIDAIRARSKAGKSGPWVSDYDEMARKTVVRRLAKYLPLTVELAKAFEHDADTLDAEAIDVTGASNEEPAEEAEVPALPEGTKTGQLAQELKSRRGKQPAEAAAPAAEGKPHEEPPPGDRGPEPEWDDLAPEEGEPFEEPPPENF